MKTFRNKSLLSYVVQSIILGAVSFGGGTSIITMVEDTFVHDLEWITEKDMLDQITLANSLPGATTVNLSILVGYHMFGLAGAILGMLGILLVPFLSIVIISLLYDSFCNNEVVSLVLKVVRAIACANVVAFVIRMLDGLIKEHSLFSWLIFAGVVIADLAFGINTALLMIISAAISVLYTMLLSKKTVKAEKEE